MEMATLLTMAMMTNGHNKEEEEEAITDDDDGSPAVVRYCSRVQWPRPPSRRRRAGCRCAWVAP